MKEHFCAVGGFSFLLHGAVRFCAGYFKSKEMVCLAIFSYFLEVAQIGHFWGKGTANKATAAVDRRVPRSSFTGIHQATKSFRPCTKEEYIFNWLKPASDVWGKHSKSSAGASRSGGSGGRDYCDRGSVLFTALSWWQF